MSLKGWYCRTYDKRLLYAVVFYWKKYWLEISAEQDQAAKGIPWRLAAIILSKKEQRRVLRACQGGESPASGHLLFVICRHGERLHLDMRSIPPYFPLLTAWDIFLRSTPVATPRGTCGPRGESRAWKAAALGNARALCRWGAQAGKDGQTRW